MLPKINPMKQLVLFLCLIPSMLWCQKPGITSPQVDQRVELMSIVFRLAGAQEYTARRFPEYVAKIEAHFEPYKDHALIKYVKRKVRKRGVGYDAVMSMAISITEPPKMEPLQAFSATFPEARWGEKRATKFLVLLNKFYQDSQAEQFFKSNEALYELASQRFNKNYEELDLDWYAAFYGAPPKSTFKIINGLGNGGGNYGPKLTLDNGQELVYAIMGTWSVDSLGQPQYPLNSYFPTLLHEFNHSFVNHIVEKFHNELKGSGQSIYQSVAKRMRSQAYGTWETMYAEAVVRASVIKYLQDHEYNPAYIKEELNTQINRGFIWTPELVKELDRYDQQRDQFPDLESFMPEIIKFFDRTAERIKEIEANIEAQRPQIVAIAPFENGDQNIDPQLKEIIVTFDRPMLGKGYSINYGKGGKKTFPEMGEITYSEDFKSITIEMELKPGRTYEFILMGKAFRAKTGLGIKDYPIRFKTKSS